MKETSLRRAAQCAGIVAALAVPALVVGQNIQGLQNLNLGDGAVLRGQDVRALRDALTTAVARIDELEGRLNGGSGISKNSFYQRTDAQPVAPNIRDTASASCDAPADIAVDCACGGDRGDGTSGFPGVDLRIVTTVNPAGGISRCDCVGENVGGDPNQRVVAVVTCLKP